MEKQRIGHITCDRLSMLVFSVSGRLRSQKLALPGWTFACRELLFHKETPNLSARALCGHWSVSVRENSQPESLSRFCRSFSGSCAWGDGVPLLSEMHVCVYLHTCAPKCTTPHICGAHSNHRAAVTSWPLAALWAQSSPPGPQLAGLCPLCC